jgi:hypothetical protein
MSAALRVPQNDEIRNAPKPRSILVEKISRLAETLEHLGELLRKDA